MRAIEYADRQSMQIDADKIERLDEQSELLLGMYQLELAKDPGSHATAVSRSNMIVLRHTIDQIYGGARFVDPVVSESVEPEPGQQATDHPTSQVHTPPPLRSLADIS